MLYLKPTGEIICEQINGISKLKLTYLLNIESDLQTQITDILTDIATKAAKIYVDSQDALLQGDINLELEPIIISPPYTVFKQIGFPFTP